MDADNKQTCQKCFGTGVYTRSWVGGTTEVTPCPTCKGEGNVLLSVIDLKKVKKRLDDIEEKIGAIIEKLNE